MPNEDIKNRSDFIWSVADILRGDLKAADFGKVILPFTVLRRLDAVLAPTKEAVLETAAGLPKEMDEAMRAKVLRRETGKDLSVYNLSQFTFESLRGQDAADLRQNLVSYISLFSPNAQDIFVSKFKFPDVLKELDEKGLLWLVFERFYKADLHPRNVSNLEMGYIFEELIRKFSEASNETAGEHYTPREVVRLLVGLLLVNDHDALTKPGVIRHVFDPAAATGGMLSIAEEEMRKLNPKIGVRLFGQELNGESFAICKSDMMITGHDPENIAHGNSLTDDAHDGRRFHYMLSNPPYGVKWEKYSTPIKAEAAGSAGGRFHAGLPRISDGQLLFLQHMISKMRDDEQGSRIGIVMNGSPLFTGGAGSGESEIRRWLMEEDLVEAIVALPTDLFYNTGIQTYAWIVTNRKTQERRNKVQLIDASGERFWKPMRKSLGAKRREIGDEAREEILRIYGEALNGDAGYGDVSKIFGTRDFGYREVRIERPLRLRFEITEDGLAKLRDEGAVKKLIEAELAALEGALMGELGDKTWMDRAAFLDDLKAALKKHGLKIGAPVQKAIVASFRIRDEDAEICRDKDGHPEPDPQLRDHELVPLDEDWRDYVAREVTPFVPDAWVDESYVDYDKTTGKGDGQVGRVGYEISFNRYFYRYVPPETLETIEAEMKELEREIAGLLREVVA